MGVYSGNRTLLGESMGVDNIGHVLDFVIECERNELKLFDAVIGCDMIQAYTEAGLTTLSEADNDDAQEQSKKSLGQKIKELFKKAIATVQRFVRTFIAKVSNFFSNDAKLIKEYKSNFGANAVGYELPFDWKPINYNKVQEAVGVFGSGVLSKEFEKRCNFIGSSRENLDSDKLTKIIEDYKKENKELDPYKTIEETFWEKEEKSNYVLTNRDVAGIGAIMAGSTSLINSVKRAGNFEIKELKSAQNSIKIVKSTVDNDSGLAILNAQYKLANIFIKQSQKILNAIIGGLTRILAQCRRAYVSAGKNATEKKATTEATVLYDNLLAEASDIYVMQALDMTV